MMSEIQEVPLILGWPDYDLPLDTPKLLPSGDMLVVGRDSLGYVWRFEGNKASLWAEAAGEAVGESLGELPLPRAAPDDPQGRVALLRQVQADGRAVRSAYVELAQTMFAFAGPTPSPELRERLERLYHRSAPSLVVFTDPQDDRAHGAFRRLPQIVGVNAVPESKEEREVLHRLIADLLERHAALLGIEEPETLLRSAAA